MPQSAEQVFHSIHDTAFRGVIVAYAVHCGRIILTKEDLDQAFLLYIEHAYKNN